MELAEEIIRLLTKKLQLFEEILSCARSQNSLSYVDHAVEYDNLIESRSICMVEIDKLNVILKRELDKIKGASGTETIKDQLALFDNKINGIIKETLDLDKLNQEKLLKEQINLRNRIQNIHQGRKGVAGYSTNNKKLSAAGAYTDSKR